MSELMFSLIIITVFLLTSFWVIADSVYALRIEKTAIKVMKSMPQSEEENSRYL